MSESKEAVLKSNRATTQQSDSGGYQPSRWNIWSRINLRTKIISAFIIVTTLAVAVIAAAVSQTTQGSLEEQIGENLAIQASTQLDLIDAFFIEKSSSLRALASNENIRQQIINVNNTYTGSDADVLAQIQAIDASWSTAPATDQIVATVLSADPEINRSGKQIRDFQFSFEDHVEIFITDIYGATVAASNRTTDYYQADEEWWQRAWNNGQGAVYISNPVFDESAGTTAIIIALPIEDERSGATIGILRSTVIVESLYGLIEQNQLERKGFTTVYNSSGETIFATRSEETAGLAVETIQELLQTTKTETAPEDPHLHTVVESASGDELLIGYARTEPRKVNSNVSVISIGSGAGFERFCVAGDTDVANSSRAIRESEIEACKAIGRTPVEFRVGTDAIAVTVSNKNNFVTNVTAEELAAIFTTAQFWSDVRPEWPAEPILRFVPGSDSGTLDFFAEAVLDGNTDGIFTASNLRSSEDDTILAQGVISNPYAIGFFGYAYYLNYQDQIRPLSINGVGPNNGVVENSNYILSRPLYLYSDAGILREKPQVAAYINFFLNNINDASAQTGYFPASGIVLDASQKAWLEATGQSAWVELNPKDFSNDIITAGSSTVFPLALEIAERFETEQKDSYRKLLSKTADETLQEVSNLGWTVVVGQTTAQAFVSGDILNRSVALNGLLAIAISAIIAILFSQFLVGPIIRLTNDTRRFAQGDIELQTTVSSQDEIGALAQTFNSMAAQLRSLIGSLEERVEERTAALENRATQLEAISSVARTTASLQNVDELLPALTRLVSDRFGYYHTGIFLIDDDREYALLRASNSAGGQKMLEREHKLKLDENSIVGHVASRGEPRIVLDVGADSAYLNNPDLPSTRSEIALPLRIGNRIIGVLDVQSTDTNAFSTENVSTLTTLADQVAIAIENSRLYTESQRALEESRETFGRYVLQEWKAFTSQAKVTGYKFDGKKSEPLNRKKEPVQIPVPQTGSLSLGRKSGNVTVPIRYRGQVIGVLEVSPRNKERKWTDDDMALLEAAVERTAVALENARLVESSQQRAQRERTIGEISSKIGSTSNLDTILKTTLEELSRRIGGASEVTFELGTESDEKQIEQ